MYHFSYLCGVGQVFVNRISEFISSNRLLGDGAHVIVGLSGGADSTALLVVLLRLGYKCTAVHCNFHLRGAESDRDQQFVTDLCKKTGVELIVCSYDTQSYAKQKGISIEMAARELRYTDFERIMNETGADAVCIAHHRDDSVETVLLNLIRGTGIKGLTGIKPRNGNIIRPLLCVSRQDIEDWLKEIGQSYITDSTNLETDYTRNKIRLQLLPMMRAINPDADNAIATTAAHLQESYAIYRDAIDKASATIIKGADEGFSIDIPQLVKLPSASAFLFEVLSPLGFNSTQIQDVEASAQAQPGVKFCSATHELIKGRDEFYVHELSSDSFEPIEIKIEPGKSVTLPDGRTLTISTAPAGTPISKDPEVATFDMSLLKGGSLAIRPWAAGDSFIPFGMKGRKLVSDFLTDIKISPAERKRQLVVSFDKDIIWLLGHRASNLYRVTKQTGKQLILTISD